MNKLEVYTCAFTALSRWDFFLCDQVCCLVPPGTGTQTTSLYHIRSHPVSQAPVCLSGTEEFPETLISSISFKFRSENENLFYNLTRRCPWGTLNTAQISDLPHVLSLWKPKWYITEGTSGEMLNQRRSWHIVRSGRQPPKNQSLAGWKTEIIYLLTVLEAGKSEINMLARLCSFWDLCCSLVAMAPSLCAHLAFPWDRCTGREGRRSVSSSSYKLIYGIRATSLWPYLTLVLVV